MLERACERFADQPVEVLRHDLAEPLPDLGRFDSVVSALAIHHLEDERKRSLYAEIFRALEPGGCLRQLRARGIADRASSSALLRRDRRALECEDPSDRLVDVETQLRWLREIGFEDVDCYWKWLRLALLVGVTPSQKGG